MTISAKQAFEFKVLDVLHYTADAVVSAPSILKDEDYIFDMFARAGMEDKMIGAAKNSLKEAVEISSTGGDLSVEALTDSLLKSRKKASREFGSALLWASRNAAVMAPVKGRDTISSTYSANKAMKIFLG
jgi:hypothetical protein